MYDNNILNILASANVSKERQQKTLEDLKEKRSLRNSSSMRDPLPVTRGPSRTASNIGNNNHTAKPIDQKNIATTGVNTKSNVPIQRLRKMNEIQKGNIKWVYLITFYDKNNKFLLLAAAPIKNSSEEQEKEKHGGAKKR
jgi:hypothetical protein